MGGTRIRSARAEPLEFALPVPFETSQARRDRARNVLITVELESGACGIGEAAPAPHVTGERPEETLQILQAFAANLVGADAARYRAVSAKFQALHPAAHAARAGLEMALLDAYCRHLGAPLFQFLGGACSQVITDVTIPIVPPEEAAQAAQAAFARGFTDLKVKIGAGEADRERVLAVAAAAPGARVRLDGNQGLTAAAAVRLLAEVQRAGVNVVLFEQPLPRHDLEGARMVRQQISVPLALDESVLSPQDAWEVARRGAADVVNIKLMKSGLLGALEIIGVCRAAGLRLMLGCMLESRHEPIPSEIRTI
ncbi:MAG: enolase C-terminal domain-like protein, partial [Armatimonadota bacterium]|nr:enolase C-terminal domain-like protein [Armatimonadota bacterium]